VDDRRVCVALLALIVAFVSYLQRHESLSPAGLEEWYAIWY
jgi:hypothetical protein